ncbi:HAD family hydrolase [Hydrogenimonas thermophila]|uniref:phosphoglycolate phosphatase n=1 Tax=Hydrogenimonas thermophila TaxID=223786 RepID=A0A1I5L877_9BACT|nr:HAD family hydrolase [Hydrogenimonas thermophila]SFO93383.1 phosphoglycolate phosphatase [Hydrogenimonas thermophila]
MKTIILFDLDGTLIDSTKAILESFSVAFESFNKPVPDQEKIKSLIGYPLDVMFISLGIEEEIADNFVQEYKKHYRKISCQKTILLPSAESAVKKASEFARLGIVTTKTGRYSRELLEHLNLMQYFEILIGREDVINPKPHPEPILKALEYMNVKDETCWMIGDTLLDVQSAKSANITPIALTCGYGKKEELCDSCEHIVENVFSAIEIIDEKKA